MIERSFAGKPPRITFTLDFHELVRGDLAPGRTVVLRYDPKRIVPSSEPYLFGDPDRPIIAHVQFRPDQPPLDRTLLYSCGSLKNPDVDVTGGGDMLTAEFAIPPDAQNLTAWFSYISPVSGVHYDSDDGRNFHFGFPSCQIKVLSATVATDPATSDSRFALRVAAIKEVYRVLVRLRLIKHPDFGKAELDLSKTSDSTDEGWPIWELTGVNVRHGAVVQFKLYYWIGDISYKDDNSGLYYMAPQPEPEHVPAPPPALAQAAETWAGP
jgi:hypothetical protein